MSWSRHFAERSVLLITVAVFATLALSGAAVWAQTPAPASVAPAVDQNCAVSTARIGSVDVTEFFGVRGGSAAFAQNFGGLPNQAPPPALRCIRLEVENPSPSDLVPVGGYVMSGFAFDPTVGANQGSGITGIEVFLDDPNQGGGIVGNANASSSAASGARLGIPSPRATAFGEQFTNSGFRLTIQIPSSATGSQHAVFVLAQSTTGRVGTVAVPIIVGNLTPASPTQTP